ncbi:SDR family oxidoreductase [Granulosicoccus antarcticus]|uniref:3-oxoacyl-[acyl-carrier-protein] reductase 1 n=1 Tax=Granulosicoccus antarcticus IMCC3135 TaxID=1192854 RepID=A0A2Z2NNZ7_9GAMM|nr:SDR family oxidoreductase [Granulosicoccus antarcticus]ASJ72255.1 3-oxoacyl-[acyl-carrier-protein] reductase 1 [Granulosicoccus antarcticus IMCC3135]
MDLKGKVIVVTGAGRGLGLSMSQAFAAKGAKLALVDLDEAALADAAKLCQQAGGEARCYRANVADESEVVQLYTDVVNDFGRLDGTVNNAGITRDGLLVKVKDGKVVKKMELKEWQSVIDVDLTGVFLCAREAAVKMIELGKPGLIINISSISRAGNIGQTNYSAAKAGVAAMTVTWAKELARYNIRVVAIAPGFANTPMVAGMKSEILEKVKSGIPLRRLAEADEIALTSVFLFENDYCTGRVIEVDGGLRL